MSAPAQARAWLSAQAGAGGLPYVPGGDPAPEPTVYALSVGVGGDAALAWLARADLGWTTLLLPAALASLPAAQALRERALSAILALHPEPVEPGEAVEGSFTWDAWPWVAGTNAWVEPTSYAIVSLVRSGQGAHARVTAGRAMLRDRRCRDGGWNYGNTRVLGSELESDPPPTAWASLALGGHDPAALAVLRAAPPSTLALSLGILAHLAGGAPAAPLVDALVARQRPDGSFGGRVDWTALAVLALDVHEGGAHPYAT